MLVAHAGGNFQYIQVDIFINLIFIYPDNDIFALVDPGLPPCRRFFDAQFGHTGFDGLGHTAHLFHFSNNLAGLTHNPIGQRFQIIGAPQRINDIADL